MAHSPLAQFTIKQLVPLEVFGFDISFTNASLFMVLATIAILGFFALATPHATEGAPSKFQLAGENLYQLIAGMLEDNAGVEGRKFIALIFTFFLFILFCNLLGMVPYGFTVTSHIAVTFFIAAIIFFTIIITGFIKQGLGFLGIFLPKGVPLWLAPLIILIELFAFLARPISLSLRLAVNMVAGHVLLKVLAGFMVTLSALYKFVPLPLIVALIGFEIFVAILQAYIFAILSCIYLSDAVNSH